MQSGGSEPDIVAQMIDLQAEAQSLENNQAAAAKAKKKSNMLKCNICKMLTFQQSCPIVERSTFHVTQ